MSSAPGKCRVFLANLAWLLASLPGWLAFLWGSRRVRKTQCHLLAGMLKRNAATEFGCAHHFESIAGPEDYRFVPLTDYDDLRGAIDAIKNGQTGVLTDEPVQLLQPTSGSTAATKLIPYTQSLRAQFKAAVDPWIASLYLAFPSLLFGRHYWSISPATPLPPDPASRVRIGFADDAEYLGGIQRLMTRFLFTVPPEIARVTDQEAFAYLTLLFLCRERNLRLASVWHPSFLTVLLKALPGHFPALLRDVASGTINPELPLDPSTRAALAAHLSPHPARARELARLDLTAPDWPQAVWPRLRLISCWTEGVAEPWLSELRAAFPRAFIQGKGLTATEGIVTFPLGRSGQRVCAVRSHYLEFLDPVTGKTYNAWEIEAGREYSVVLTTGGGLYRYRLHDLVRVTGFYHQAPCLEFIARDNLVCDLVGEKLNARHVEECIHDVQKALGRRFAFAMLAPLQDGDRAGYILFIEPDAAEPGLDFERVASLMEEALQRNYHYRHARRLNQLQPTRLYRITRNAGASYRRHLITKGMKAGDIKFQALSTDLTWLEDFSGEWVGSARHESPCHSYTDTHSAK